jgi:hypothetical protein
MKRAVLALLLLSSATLAGPPPVLDSRGIIQFPAGAGPTKNGEIGLVGGVLKGYDSETVFTLRSSGSSSTGTSGATTGVYSGLLVTCDATETVTVSFSGVTASSTLSTTPLWLPTFSVTGTVPSLLDRGSEAATTWYAVHAVAKANAGAAPTVKIVLSTSATSPVLGATYTHFRRLGWVRNDGSSNLVPLQQHGDMVASQWQPGGVSLVSNGKVTVWTTVDASSQAPPTASHIYVNFYGVLSGGNVVAYVGLPGIGSIASQLACYNYGTITVYVPLTPTQQMAYVSSATIGVYVRSAGWIDDL